MLHYRHTVYPKKYAHGFCFAVLCCGYTLTDFPISIRLTSLALWQSNDCPSASKATLMNMDKYFMWILYERLRNHNKAKHNKTVCIFLGIYCTPSLTHWCLIMHLCISERGHHWFIYLALHLSDFKPLPELMMTSSVGPMDNSNHWLQWRHNGHNGISNHQPHDCWLNRLFRRRSEKTSKLHFTGLYEGNSPLTGPVTRASNGQ